jgi:hypothetical protein
MEDMNMAKNSEREIDTLYDSDTNEELTAEDLGISQERYDEVVKHSIENGGDTGHVVISEIGRRVYANY